MSDLGEKIEFVNQYIGNKGHDISSFIYFKVNDFELDTRSSDSFKHYAISLENQKTGVGQGNQFTLKIAFHKDFSHLGVNINAFEKALATLSNASMHLDVKELKNSKNRCILQYGYLTNDNNLISPKYEGMLLEYHVTANKQIVEYTLKGYTGEKAAIGVVNWYPKIKGMSTTGGRRIAELVTAKEAGDMTEAETNQLLTELNNIYSGPAQCNPYDALRIFLADYNDEMKTIAENSDIEPTIFETKLGCNGYYGKNLTESDMSKLRPVSISLCRNQTPLQYIEYLVSMFVEDTGDQYALQFLKDESRVVDRWTYEFKRSEENYNTIQVWINKITSDENDVYDYHFKGYTNDNNLLIDYTLNYDGTVALAVSDSIDKENEDNSIYIDSRGQLQAKAVLTRDMFVEGAFDEVQVKTQNTWLDKISCANNCTITTFGLPFEIPVGAIFKVTLYIGDAPHHESGRCFLTGIVDKIDNGQFITEFTAIRLPGKGEDVTT